MKWIEAAEENFSRYDISFKICLCSSSRNGQLLMLEPMQSNESTLERVPIQCTSPHRKKCLF